MKILNSSPKANGPIVTKLHVEPPGAEGLEICPTCPGDMTNMAAMPINVERSFILFFSRTS